MNRNTFRSIWKLLGLGLLSAIHLLAGPGPVTAQTESTSTSGQQPKFGGPDQVDNQIANDEASTSRIVTERLLDPYFEWKKNLQEKRGLSLSGLLRRLPECQQQYWRR